MNPVTKPGTLYIVGTPIGNLEDLTFRALRTLKEVAVIAAEDTRHTQRLLHHYGLSTPLTSYHDHNKEEKTEVLIVRLKEGMDIALVCDAGTPMISDPGYYLIRRAIQERIPVSPIPGPTAPIAALSIAGLPTDAFIFEGFLPARKSARRKHLQALSNDTRTLILFEAPHRLLAMLQDLRELFGDRPLVITRELTKIHQEVLRGTATAILGQLEGVRIRGEVTLVIEGAQEKNPHPMPITRFLENLRDNGLRVKEAASLASMELGVSKKSAYSEALRIWGRQSESQ